MIRKLHLTVLTLLVAMAALLPVEPVRAQTVERIRETGALRIGYRIDAVPFSYKDDKGQPAGYTVDLCRLVAEGIKKRLKLKALDVTYVPVTTEGRFKAIEDKKIDLLCGATTVTLDRRAKVDFSVLTFFTGASVALKIDGPLTFDALDGKVIGVRKGTTTESALAETLKDQNIKARIVAVGSHKEGLDQVAAGKIAAYFADRAILAWMVAAGPHKDRIIVARNMFGPEPYALALPLGDTKFRILVDRMLSDIYRSKAIVEVFDKNFAGAKPAPVILSLYLLNALPE